MKKDEITRVRLLSLAVLMTLSLFILLVPIGSNEFAQIISKMNNNALNIPESQNSVYNLYYYTGFNVVYQLFFSLTILFTAMSVAGILLRIGNTGIVAFVSAILNFFVDPSLLSTNTIPVESLKTTFFTDISYLQNIGYFSNDPSFIQQVNFYISIYYF